MIRIVWGCLSCTSLLLVFSLDSMLFVFVVAAGIMRCEVTYLGQVDVLVTKLRGRCTVGTVLL